MRSPTVREGNQALADARASDTVNLRIISEGTDEIQSWRHGFSHKDVHAG